MSLTRTDHLLLKVMEMRRPPSEKQSITTQFVGTATIRTNYQGVEGPIIKDVSFSLRFEGDRTRIVIDDISPIKTDPFDTPLGKNTTTVTLIGQAVGTFDPSSGMINVPAKLLIDHSIDLPILKEDSTIDILLSTGSIYSPLGNMEGSPLGETGQITLVGAAQFMGGILNGYWGVIEIKGVISPYTTNARSSPYQA